LYDDVLHDVLVKHIARKAQWQEKFLQSVETQHLASLPTIVFVDEPSLALVGASLVALNRDEVVRDLEEVFAGLHGLKGTHCCGNTDWGMLLETSVNAISFDAYTYAENLALFADAVKKFLDRGGVLVWGIVPTVEEHIASETVASLVARLDAGIDRLVKKGIDRDLLYERAIITPACGLGTISEAFAERALALTQAVSQQIRAREKFGD
jgi:methionine synthase II (cobalamin-independent)